MQCNLLFPADHCVLLSFHSDPYHIFFYQGSSATADVHEDIVLRFAHAGFNRGFNEFIRDYRFYLFYEPDDNYYYYRQQPSFEYSFKINTPFPYHAELHINRTQFDYEGEYFILYRYPNQLRSNFVINVNSKLYQNDAVLYCNVLRGSQI